MKDYSIIQEIYANNFCGERLYIRKTCPNLTYTDGVMDFAEVLNAHWIVDNIILYMPNILKTSKVKFSILISDLFKAKTSPSLVSVPSKR